MAHTSPVVAAAFIIITNRTLTSLSAINVARRLRHGNDDSLRELNALSYAYESVCLCVCVCVRTSVRERQQSDRD